MPRPANPADTQPSNKNKSSSSSSSSSLISRPVTIIDPGKSRPSGIGDCVFLEEERQQSIGMLYGGPGSGKSYFALRYMPEPIMFINLDGRARKVVREITMEHKRKIHYIE